MARRSPATRRSTARRAAAGENPAAWTAYSGTLGATATTFNLPNREAGATYEAQVLAVTGDTESPWSATGEGTANRPPTATTVAFNGGTFPVGSIADYKESGQGALGIFFQDADSDALTYAATAQRPALLGVSLSGGAGEAHLQATLLNQGSSELTFTASDPYGGRVTRHGDHQHHREGEPERCRELPRRHAGRRPGDRDAVQ